MRDVRPLKPSSPDPLAADLLAGLGGFPCAQWIVLGGYFALKHYCDYRPTNARIGFNLEAAWLPRKRRRAAAKLGLCMEFAL
jgi:uncharacterized protein involved in cysteine biosynthesis